MKSNLDLQEQFGNIDVYLFDQLLKNRIVPQMRVLDAGCGAGRNLVYLLRGGGEVFGVDASPEAISIIRQFAANAAPQLPASNFRVETVENMSFPDAHFDAVISSAVLHFARDARHWLEMVAEMWRVLKPGGVLFARLAANVGIEDLVERIEGERYLLPDGGVYFIANPEMLLTTTESLGAELLEPIKTVVVHRQRAMSVWCLRKPAQ